MKIPNEWLEQLAKYCVENGWGMMEITNKSRNFHLIVLGDSEAFSPDQISILAAHCLLDHVVSGATHNENEVMKEMLNDDSPKH